jgi:hypothetical protein
MDDKVELRSVPIRVSALTDESPEPICPETIDQMFVRLIAMLQDMGLKPKP